MPASIAGCKLLVVLVGEPVVGLLLAILRALEPLAAVLDLVDDDFLVAAAVEDDLGAGGAVIILVVLGVGVVVHCQRPSA